MTSNRYYYGRKGALGTASDFQTSRFGTTFTFTTDGGAVIGGIPFELLDMEFTPESDFLAAREKAILAMLAQG